MSDAGATLLARLARRGVALAELFEKQGSSRMFARGAEGESVHYAVESGWAVRAGDGEHSWFRAGSGGVAETLEPGPATPQPLRLPEPAPPRAAPPSRLDAPLASEAEGMSLLAGVARELARELPGAQLGSARLDDGVSEFRLRSSRGIDARVRARSTLLRVEATAGPRRLAAEFLARAAGELKPLALARRLADRLLALAGESSVPAAGSSLLLAAPVVARLVEALAPRLVGGAAGRALVERLGEAPRLGSELATLVDDGSDPAGVLAAPFDGEGVPSAPARLVVAGVFERPLVAWWEAGASPATGCSRRVGWRDLPRRAPTQLRLEPEPRVTVADLVEQGGASAYLVAAEGGIRIDAVGRFALPVSGFALAGGRGAGALGRCLLRGEVEGWMRGLEAVARDLTYVPGDGLYGAPSAVVSGFELVAAAADPTAG